MAWYLDTSALVKLVVAEEHSKPMRAWASTSPSVVTSELTRTEALRVARRMSATVTQRMRAALEGVMIGAMTSTTFERAAELDPAVLRTLDSLHLAWALALGDDLDGVVTYDRRLADGASLHGLRVLAPM